MKIIIRYLEIYIYIQDLRIYDIIKNSVTTTANRIFILNKSYGNRTFCTNLHSQKFNVSALILSVSVFKLSTFETSRPMVFCSSLALSLLLSRLHVSNIRTPHWSWVLYYVDFGTAFLIRFEDSSSLNSSAKRFASNTCVNEWNYAYVHPCIYFDNYMYLTFPL